MVAAYPEVRVVIDHLARIELSSPDAEQQLEQLIRFAQYPNVWVKVTELSLLSPSKAHPYSDTFALVKRVYDAFTPDRLLWGTGFPGTTRAQAGRPPLAEELALVRREIPFFSASDREKILGANAAKLWRFPGW
jgi:predicted TIM-barrel fold metal-dependent hydrolase